jgi:hypothetical protein
MEHAAFSFHSEDVRDIFLQNIWAHLQNYTVLQTTPPKYESSSLWKPQILWTIRNCIRRPILKIGVRTDVPRFLNCGVNF